MRLHLVRHGETDWNAAKRIQGTIDIGLNATGRRQAEELGAELTSRGAAFAGIRTSALKRARSTAQILASRLGRAVAEVPDLHEMDFGAWQGLTWGEVEARYPDEFHTWLKERRMTRAPGGESYDDLLARVLKALEALCQSATQGDIHGHSQDELPADLLVVTHGAVILSLRCLVEGGDFAEMDRLRVGNLERFVLEDSVLKRLVGGHLG